MPANFEEPKGHEIATVGSGKVAKNSRKPKQKRQQAEDRIVEYAQRIDQEVQGFSSETSELVKGFMYHQADQAIDALEGAEEHFFERFEQRLGGLQVDPDNFRDRSESLKSRLLQRLGVVKSVSDVA